MATRQRRGEGSDTSTVHLTRIYTRTGDDGTTGLGDMSRSPKTGPRVAAYGDVDDDFVEAFIEGALSQQVS